MYHELEKTEGNEEIAAIEQQIRWRKKNVMNFKKQQAAGSVQKAAADVFKGGIKGEFIEKEIKVEVPKQIKIEYMLRFYC